MPCVSLCLVLLEATKIVKTIMLIVDVTVNYYCQFNLRCSRDRFNLLFIPHLYSFHYCPTI